MIGLLSQEKIIDYLSKDSVYDFIDNSIEKVKYCEEAIKKKFNKELAMSKEDE